MHRRIFYPNSLCDCKCSWASIARPLCILSSQIWICLCAVVPGSMYLGQVGAHVCIYLGLVMVRKNSRRFLFICYCRPKRYYCKSPAANNRRIVIEFGFALFLWLTDHSLYSYVDCRYIPRYVPTPESRLLNRSHFVELFSRQVLGCGLEAFHFKHFSIYLVLSGKPRHLFVAQWVYVY